MPNILIIHVWVELLSYGHCKLIICFCVATGLHDTSFIKSSESHASYMTCALIINCSRCTHLFGSQLFCDFIIHSWEIFFKHTPARTLYSSCLRLVCVCEWVCVCVCVCTTSASGSLNFLENQILVGCIDFGTNLYVLVWAQSSCQVCLVCLLTLPFQAGESLSLSCVQRAEQQLLCVSTFFFFFFFFF